MIKRFFVPALMFLASDVQAHGGEEHEGMPEYDWAMDILLAYRDQPAPVARGFLVPAGHGQQAGFALQHLDISRNFSWQPGQQARVTASSHDGSAVLDEAWSQWKANAWTVRFGQQMPDVGLQNAQHEHAWTMIGSSLLDEVFWGGQFSEAGINISHRMGKRWRLLSQAGIYSARQFAATDDSAALLLSLTASYHPGDFTLGIKADAYHANLQGRGLNLFSVNTQSHSHSSSYTEYFDGHLNQVGAGLFARYPSTAGELALTAEYQARTDSGELRSATGQTTDASASLELDSWGGYVQLAWHGTSGLILAARHEYLGSDVGLTNLASSDLENSVLNNQGEDPQRSSWLLGYRLQDAGNTVVKYQRQQQNSWLSQAAEWQLLIQQSYRF